MARHTKSEIWRYFEYVNLDTAKCNNCGKFYSRKGRTTTSLKNHLKSGHPEQYLEFITADWVRLEKKFVTKPCDNLALNIADKHKLTTWYNEHIVAETSIAASQMYDAIPDQKGNVLGTHIHRDTNDSMCRDPILIPPTRPNGEDTERTLQEYRANPIQSLNKVINLQKETETSAGPSVEDKNTSIPNGRRNYTLPIVQKLYDNSDHGVVSDEDDFDKCLQRKKLLLEVEHLELKNYKMKLELLEMEQKFNLNCSKFTADIRRITVKTEIDSNV